MGRFYKEEEIPLIGSLLYGVAALFACIFAGLMQTKKEKTIEEVGKHIEVAAKSLIAKDDEKEQKRLRKNRLISQRAKEVWARRKAEK